MDEAPPTPLLNKLDVKSDCINVMDNDNQEVNPLLCSLFSTQQQVALPTPPMPCDSFASQGWVQSRREFQR